MSLESLIFWSFIWKCKHNLQSEQFTMICSPCSWMSLVCAIKQQQSLIWIFHSIHSMRKGPTTTTLFLIKHIFDLFYTHTWKETSIHPLLVLIRSFCICTLEDLENQISSISIFFCSHMQHMAGARPHQNHSQSFEILSMGLSQRWVIREKQAQSCRHL